MKYTKKKTDIVKILNNRNYKISGENGKTVFKKRQTQKGGDIMEFFKNRGLLRIVNKVKNSEKALKSTVDKLEKKLFDFQQYITKYIIKHQTRIIELTLINRPSSDVDLISFGKNRENIENSRKKLLERIGNNDVIKLIYNLRKVELEYNIKKSQYKNTLSRLKAKYNAISRTFQKKLGETTFTKQKDAPSSQEQKVSAAQNKLNEILQNLENIETSRTDIKSNFIHITEKKLKQLFEMYGMVRYYTFLRNDKIKVSGQVSVNSAKFSKYRKDRSLYLLKEIKKLRNARTLIYTQSGGTNNNNNSSNNNELTLYKPETNPTNLKAIMKNLHINIIELMSLNIDNVKIIINRDLGIYKIDEYNLKQNPPPLRYETNIYPDIIKFPVYVEQVIYAYGKNKSEPMYHSYGGYIVSKEIADIESDLEKKMILNAKFLVSGYTKDDDKLLLNNSCFRAIVAEDIYNTMDIFPAALKYITDKLPLIVNKVNELTATDSGTYIEEALLLDLQQYLDMLYFDLYYIIQKISNSTGNTTLNDILNENNLSGKIVISGGATNPTDNNQIYRIIDFFDNRENRENLYNGLKEHISFDTSAEIQEDEDKNISELPLDKIKEKTQNKYTEFHDNILKDVIGYDVYANYYKLKKKVVTALPATPSTEQNNAHSAANIANALGDEAQTDAHTNLKTAFEAAMPPGALGGAAVNAGSIPAVADVGAVVGTITATDDNIQQ